MNALGAGNCDEGGKKRAPKLGGGDGAVSIDVISKIDAGNSRSIPLVLEETPLLGPVDALLARRGLAGGAASEGGGGGALSLGALFTEGKAKGGANARCESCSSSEF